MEETILVVGIIVLFLFSYILIGRIKNPLTLLYVRILAVIAMLILIWVFGGESKIPIRVILSTIVLSSLYREYKIFKKSKTKI